MMVDVDVANANVLLAGIFDIRNGQDDGLGCGTPSRESIMGYEAALWTIRKINNDNYVPGVKFGMKGYDTCYSRSKALIAANNFYQQFSTRTMYCNNTDKLNLGIVGTLSSWTTKPLAELTSKFQAPMISPLASSPALSDKSRFPYFLRTALSSGEQNKAILTLLGQFQWKRVVVVYQDNDYGVDSKDDFIRQAAESEICVVGSVVVPHTPQLSTYIEALQQLSSYNTVGAVYFGVSESMVLNAIEAIPSAADIQWILSYADLNGNYLSKYIRGTVFLQPRVSIVNEFIDYFTTSIDENNPPASNPWYQDWFMTMFQCKLSGVNYAPYATLSVCSPKTPSQKRAAINQRYETIDATVKAVYAYAKALRDAQGSLCGGVGLCNALRSMSPQQFHSYLMNVNLHMNDVNIASLSNNTVAFDQNGDNLYSAHRIWNYNDFETPSTYSFKDFGQYGGNTGLVVSANLKMYNNLRTTALAAIPKSNCPEKGCSNCIVPHRMINFDYHPGDVVIAGLFDIHAPGKEVLTCGALKAMHALNAAAFTYGIRTAKTRFPSILNGVDLGSLVVDLCDNAETGRLLMNNILSGRSIVSDMYGQVVDPNPIKGIVGALDSTEAMSMAELLGQSYNLPYMDASATSTELSDTMMFPTFTRNIPSDLHQIRAIVRVLKRLGWSYIQVVYSPNTYGRNGFNILRDEGAKHSICIAAAHEYTNGTHIVQGLKNVPEAKAIVAIVDYDDYRDIMMAIKNQGLQRQFVLVATETWGSSGSIVAGLEDIAEGTLSVAISSPALDQFRQWLDTINETSMETMRKMPFFVEWYQYSFQCYIHASNRGKYSQQCNRNTPITLAPRYSDNAYTPFTISATYAMANALDKVLQDICGVGYNGMCWQFRSDTTVLSKVLEYVLKTNINIDGFNYKLMNREGDVNYKIFIYSNRVYTQIATYMTGTNQFEMATVPASLSNMASVCTGFCSQCVYLLQARPFTMVGGQQIKMAVNFGASNPDTTDPFLCQGFTLTNGFQTALATFYAIQMVNAGKAPVALNNIDVGAMFFDHCNSPARANGLPAALYSGLLEAKGEEEPIPNLNTIRSWMTDNTMVTEQMKQFFKDLNLPVLSPMSTSNTFLDEEEYPTFLRTIQGDSTISTALAVIAKALGLQYVNVIYSANNFGRQGAELFHNIAMQEGVCVLESLELGSMTLTNIVNQLVNSPTHVVVAYLNENDMHNFLQTRSMTTSGNKLVILSPENYPLIYRKNGNAAKNVVSLRMKANDLVGYREFLKQMSAPNVLEDHPTLKAFYMQLFECNLPGEYRYSQTCIPNRSITDSPNFFVDNYVLPTINAVYSFVWAVHETLKIQCGQDYTQKVCTKFYSDPNTNTIILTKMRESVFRDDSGANFEFTGKEGNTGREIVLYNGLQTSKIADFAGASVHFIDDNLQRMFDQTQSGCVFPCQQCVNNMMNFTFIPGDILLGGLFDVHESDLTPFSCGKINTLRGFQLLEAFHFALNKVNDKSGMFANILKDVKLGGVGLDACQSAARGGYIVSNIHNGITTLQRNDQVIQHNDIEAYVGTYSSGRSIYLARLLKTLKIPQISYGSSSIDLLDKDRYPYFIRTVPADDRQAMAMIKFLRKFDIRYVQIVHTADNYGEKGAEIFQQLALQEKICVSQTLSFPEQSLVTPESANDIVLELLNKPIANTVIVFTDTANINEMLRAVRRNPEAIGKFRFIGSDTWANNVESTVGVADLAVGSVTFDLDVQDILEFDQYLSTKTPANYPENPWFPEYYEEIQNCYLTIPTAQYPTRCQAQPKNIVTSRRYKQDTAIVHVINSVYASAIGIDSALKNSCGVNYTTVCEAFKNRDDRRDLILEYIKKAQFRDISQKDFSFSDRGDGNRGYVIYSLDTSNDQGYVYNPIGSFSSSGELSVLGSYNPGWDGSCERPDSCTECPTIRNLINRYMLPSINGQFDANAAKIVYTSGIHNPGKDAYRCGSLNIVNFMNVMATVYTVQTYARATRPFNVRSVILDNCGNAMRIDQDLYNIFSKGQLCNAEFDFGNSVIDLSTVAGVQTQYSFMVVAANRVTAPYQVQLLSGYASSTTLSDHIRYPYFARTVPPDNIQTELIARILKANDWSYVGALYSRESYGASAVRALTNIVNEGQYSCIGYSAGASFPATVEDVRPLVRNLAAVPGINVAVLLAVDPRPYLEAFIAEGVASRFILIGSDSWGENKQITEMIAQHFRGAITINFRNAQHDDFLKWMADNINYQNRLGIPDDWFEEFYQIMHDCHLPDATVQPNPTLEICDMTLDFTIDQLRPISKYLTSMASTVAIMKGLQEFKSTHACAEKTFAECMAGVTNGRQRLFNYTLKQTWDVDNGSITPDDNFNMELGDDRFWNVGYNIFNLHGSNTYTKVGDWVGTAFQFNKTAYNSYKVGNFTSQCPRDVQCDCNLAVEGNTAKLVIPKYMRDHEPRNYYMYDEDTGEQIYTWPIWAIAVAVLSCFGLLVGLILFFYFLVAYPIKGGTTILGFLTMIGLFGIYAVNFAFFLPASLETCAGRKFAMGVVYSIVFAALFIKSIDNWRFRDSGYSTEKYRGLSSPCTLILMAFGIILVQCIIPIEWLILEEPTASMMDDSTLQHDWMWCDPHDFYDISLMLSMIFVIFLVIITAIFAALAWDSEANWYESRWIFVSCVCTAGCFLVWMVVSTNAGPPYRDPAVAIGNFVNASLILIFIPIRKFVLLLRVQHEEEKVKSMPADDANTDIYSTVYTNQMYQADVFQPDSKPVSENGGY